MKKFNLVVLMVVIFALNCFSADFSVNLDIFSPNESPGEKDTLTIGGTLDQTLPVTINIYKQGLPTTIQRTIPYSQFDYNYGTIYDWGTWDGKNNSGSFVSDGVYELKFQTFISKLWTKGNANRDLRGMFGSPYDVAIGSDGKIYVLEINRIQVFDSNKNYLFSINNPDDGPGHLERPASLVVSNNKIYVMDCGYEAQNIKIFDTSGNYIKTFGGPGTGNGKFNLDWRNNIAADSTGRIWVVDGGNSRIQVFNSEGVFQFKFGTHGTEDGQFDFTYVSGNIALDSNNNAYVTDSGDGMGRIQIFNSSGGHQRTIKSYPDGPVQLIGVSGPIAIAGSSSQKYICVSSYNNNKIVILKNDGTYFGQIGKLGGSSGRGPGEFGFDSISKIRGTTNNIYSVECYDNFRVQIFNTCGVYQSQLGMTPGEFLEPRGVAIHPTNGNIYVCDSGNARIEIFNSSGAYQSQILMPYDEFFSILQPAYISFDTDGKIYVLGDEDYRLQVLDGSGNLLSSVELKDAEGNYIFTKGLVILGNYIYISGFSLTGESIQPKVFVFTKTGNFERSFDSFTYETGTGSGLSIANHLGKIYVMDTTGTYVFQTNGTQTGTFPQIKNGKTLAFDSSGKIYVSGTSENEPVKVYDNSGNFLYNFGDTDDDSDLYSYSWGIAVDTQANVYFSDDYYHRLYKYSTTADVLLDTVTVEVDNTKPIALISYPSHTPANLISDFSVMGSATDTHFEKYEVKIDSDPTPVYTGYTSVSNGILASIDISGLSSGTHTLSLFVQDLAGNTNSDSITFYIDATPPNSSVNSLNEYTNTLSFPVSWTGYDSGSGIAYYNIQYRDGIGGTWIDWFLATTQTSANFTTGQDGHTYYFRSQARDNGGNWESYPSYDTYTMIDITKPVVVKVTPPDNSYVGAHPQIKVEVSDVLPGSGIKSSNISVKEGENNLPYSFASNIITISPTFTKGDHTVVVNFSDMAGNLADTLTLHYNALNFQGSVENLDPNPNPTISEVMAGGQVYRWYRVLDQSSHPASGVTLTTQWNYNGVHQATSEVSDNEGIVCCILEADQLGAVDNTIDCSIIEAGGNAINPPLTFQVKILPRESNSEFRFGSGINLKAAVGVGGKIGKEKGLTYRIINTNLQSQSDDKIEVERSFENEAGVVAEVSAGGGVKNACYASADAGASLSLVFMNTNKFLFDNPHGSDEQQILRSGLVITSLLEEINTPIISDMLGYVISGFNILYPKYKNGEELSVGLLLEGNASAGAGLGLGNAENVMLGLGIGVGIEGEAEILGNLLFGFEYKSGELNTTEIGAGISFSAEMNLFAGLEGNAINDKVQAGIGVDLVGKHSLILFADSDGNVTRAELKIESKAEWGTEEPGSSDTTKSITIILNRDQIDAIAEDLIDIMGLQEFLEDQTSPETITVGPTEIKARFQTLCTNLTTYIATAQIPLSYQMEEEIGEEFSFEPTVKVALVAEIEVGVSYELEKVVSYTTEEGIINFAISGLKTFPLSCYEKDDYIPDCDDLKFGDVFDDCVDGIITAMTDVGELVLEAGKQVGDTIVSGMHWVSSTINEFIPWRKYSFSLTKQSGSGIGEVFSFTPEGVIIADLSSGITSAVTIENGSANLVITPGKSTGLLTISYDDTGISGFESNLLIYQWDNINRRYLGLKSIVDVNANTITADVEKLGMFLIGTPVPYGEIVLNVSPKDIDLNSPQTINVTSQPIMMATGDIVPDRTLITVTSLEKLTSEIRNYGTITTTDADSNIEGVQVPTLAGVITFSITPPDTAGSGIITANSVEGKSSGKEYFNVVNNLDANGNGLPDYWENYYFGEGVSINGDPDDDELTNMQEYLNGTNPNKFDTDNDGMPDGWEVKNQLNPLLDDSQFDPDADGYTNLVEYQNGSNPHSPPGIKGDINEDEEIDISDVILCLRMALGLPVTIQGETYTNAEYPDLLVNCANINGDGGIDISDVILVLRMALGLPITINGQTYESPYDDL